MSKYYRVPGMLHPRWIGTLVENYPGQGDATWVYHNAEADTDMGDLYGDEFAKFFPHAEEITKEEYED